MCRHCEICRAKAEEQIFKKHMEADNRILIKTPDDGNCMFYAVAAAFRSYKLQMNVPADHLGSSNPTKLQHENLKLYNFGHNGWFYRQEAARILEARLQGKYFAEQDRFPDIPDIDMMIFGEMVSYGNYEYGDKNKKWQQDYLVTLRTGAQKGQTGSKYWGGVSALAALAAYLDAKILVYNAKGELPAAEMEQMLRPTGWTEDKARLTLWFHKDDGTGRGGTHYDAFTAPHGPDPRMDPRW